jgi:DNA invertase Pin-like site-specific DNA recombinase
MPDSAPACRFALGQRGPRAKARGVKLGHKPKLTEHQKREAIRRRDHDGEPVREIAHSYNVSHSTISRLTPI